jgi:hypothetical protein
MDRSTPSNISKDEAASARAPFSSYHPQVLQAGEAIVAWAVQVPTHHLAALNVLRRGVVVEAASGETARFVQLRKDGIARGTGGCALSEVTALAVRKIDGRG